jgi:hypothetical protein
MGKFTKESFDVVSVTDIHRDNLLKGVLEELSGRETMKDVEFNEQLYCGDVFEAIASEWAELIKAGENNRQIFKISQEMIDQVDNLAEIIETELVRIISC